MRQIILAGTIVASTLFADLRGWTVGSLMPWSASRKYASGFNHK